MQVANYFAASILSFLGLVAGAILIKIAPEERKPLGKYFAWMRKAIILLIFLFVFLYYYKRLDYFLALILIFVILMVIEIKSKAMLLISAASYAAFGIIFFLSSSNLNLFAIQASLIFLHGLPTASLLLRIKGKGNYKVFSYNFLFITISNLLFVIHHFSFLIFK